MRLFHIGNRICLFTFSGHCIFYCLGHGKPIRHTLHETINVQTFSYKIPCHILMTAFRNIRYIHPDRGCHWTLRCQVMPVRIMWCIVCWDFISFIALCVQMWRNKELEMLLLLFDWLAQQQRQKNATRRSRYRIDCVRYDWSNWWRTYVCRTRNEYGNSILEYVNLNRENMNSASENISILLLFIDSKGISSPALPPVCTIQAHMIRVTILELYSVAYVHSSSSSSRERSLTIYVFR